MDKKISAIAKLYKQYLWKRSLQEYLQLSKSSKSGDEETTTDPLFRDMLQHKDLRNYSWDNVLLQQQRHRIVRKWKEWIAKPDFETNNEFCKIPIIFDSKSSNISFEEMISWIDTVFTTTFKRYLLAIKPIYKYIIWFNLGSIFLYEKNWIDNLSVKIVVDVEKLLNWDRTELENLQILLDETEYKQITKEDKINILKAKKFEDSPFNTELFFEKYRNTRNKLQRFLKKRLEVNNILQEDCDEYIKSDLPPSDNDDEFREQLANRLTMIEFFKYIFIRTYEDFGLIHFSEQEKAIIPVSYGKVIENLKSKHEWNSLFDDADNTFFEEYISKISKQWITDIGKEFFDWFSTMFKKYEWFIEDLVSESKAQYEYYNILFDVIFFLNEFNFRELWDDIIWWLYEKTLDREDRKKFWQFYTPRYIIDFILDTMFITPNENIKIADISCGTWWFLVKYLSRIKWDMIMDENKLKDIFRWAFGVDIKWFSILLTKLNIALMFILKNKALKDYNVESKKIRLNNIIQWDGLWIQNSLPIKDDDLDFIVGNPPYVWQKWNSEIFQSIRSDNFFGKMFVKRCDLYYFFIIDGIKKLKPWGKFGYIIPREWITSDSGNKLREYILANCQVLGIIDFNGISIFEDAGTSSCLLFLQKWKKHEKKTFSFIQFKNYKGKNLVKYIDDNKEKLHKKSSSKHGEAKQKVDSGYEIFSQKIFVYKTFKRIVELMEKWERFDISRLGGLTSGKIFIDDFLDITKIKQSDLGWTAWLFGQRIAKSESLVKLGEVLKIWVWIQTWCDSVWNKHIKKWLVPNNFLHRWIFVLKEEIEVKWSWLNDIRLDNKNIWKIELNLYENWWWVELNEEEKQLIKPLYFWKSLKKRDIEVNSKRVIYYNIKNYENFTNIPNIKKHLEKYKSILINRNVKWWKVLTEEQIVETEDIRKLYNLDWSTQSTLWKWLYNLLQKYWYWVNFYWPKIIKTTKWNKAFCYSYNPVFWTLWWQWGLNYIIIDDKNEYTKIIEEKTSKKDFLKFINAVLNSNYMQSFLETGNFNSITNKKLREIIYIPKIDFENEKEVKKYDEVVSIANRLIELEKENTIDISLQKKWENEIMDVQKTVGRGWRILYGDVMNH